MRVYDADQQDSGTVEQRLESAGVSRKALITSVVCVVILTWYIQYQELTELIPPLPVRAVPPTSALIFVLLLMGISAMLGRKRRLLFYSEQDLTIVYLLLAFGGLVATWGLLAINIGNMAALPILALDDPATYGSITNATSSLLYLTGRDEALAFWIGGRTGVPWGKWIVVTLVWSVFWISILMVQICLATVVRRHWIERERLAFPLAVPVLAMVKDVLPNDEASFWKNRLVYVGAIVPLVIYGSHAVATVFPTVPPIPTSMNLGRFFSTPPFNAVNTWPGLWFEYSPWVVGVGYLVSSQVSFSLWFFHALYQVSLVVESAMYGSAWIGTLRWDITRGAYLGTTLIIVWLVGHDIKSIVMSGLGLSKQREADGSDEPLSFQTAFWLGLICLTVVVCFAVFALRMSVGTVLLFFSIFFAVSLGVARLRAEGGFPSTTPMMEYTHVQLIRGFGGENMSIFDRAGLGFWFNPMVHGQVGAYLSTIIEGYKLAEDVRISKRSLTKAYVMIFLIVLFAGTAISLLIIYDNGMFNAGHFRLYHARLSFATLECKPWPQVFPSYVIGFVLAAIMGYMRAKFIWWPFHPLGLAAGIHGEMIYYAGPLFVGWLVRVSVLRYGGVSSYKKLVPVFLGLIVGSVIMFIVLFVISCIMLWFR